MRHALRSIPRTMSRTGTRSVHLALVLAVLVCAGCGNRDDRPRHNAAGTEPTAQAVPFKSTVLPAERKHTVFQTPPPLPQQKEPVLDHAGQAPRKVLRYQPDDKARELVITARIQSRELAGGEWTARTPLPEIRYGLGIQRQAMDRDMFTLDLRGLKAEVAASTQPDAGLRARANLLAAEFLARYRKLVERRRASLRLSDRGFLGELVLAPDAAESAEAPEIGQELQQLLLEAMVPLPGEAIGKGARWQATTIMRRGAGVVTQRAEYELLSMDKDRVRIKATLTQLGERQLLSMPDLPPSAMAELIALFWRAGGELDISLSSATPLAATLNVEMRAHSRLSSAGGEVDHYVESSGAVILTTR